eukprot:CAMPEP_0174902882 /NCGR_PEP_ID=MMETSP0167-20121228/40573_1 /TAXON_ID=38298 /ORGANISM="Rhodella maculata, Strain CCMP736" /LENGTH=193 /DNA_ID=CAMNT_0016145035 /DNA_START=16 /DNA_END=597 /DNA_ORIENTATION=+
MHTEAGNSSNVWAMDENTPCDTSSPSLGSLVRSGSKRLVNAISPKDTSSLRRDLVKKNSAPAGAHPAAASDAPFGSRQGSFLGAFSPRKPKAASGGRAFESVYISAATTTSPRSTPARSGLIGGSEAGKGKLTLAELVKQKRAEKEEKEKAALGSPGNVSEFEKVESGGEEAPVDLWNVSGAALRSKRFSLMK